MKKPEPPKSRLIRIDVLPEQDPMKNYRIKKVTDEDGTKYYPQEKLFGLWMNMFGCDGWYPSFEEAQRRIFYVLRKNPVVEYLEVDCGENK